MDLASVLVVSVEKLAQCLEPHHQSKLLCLFHSCVAAPVFRRKCHLVVFHLRGIGGFEYKIVQSVSPSPVDVVQVVQKGHDLRDDNICCNKSKDLGQH